MPTKSASLEPQTRVLAAEEGGGTSGLTFAEYVERERASNIRHDFYSGELHEVERGTLEHNTIAANLVGALTNALETTGCRVLGSDQKIYISERVGYYPDITVLCDSPLVAFGEALQNPVLLGEVLSDSTAANDRGAKFRHYRGITSLQHYLLIEQDTPFIEHYECGEDGIWTLRGEYAALDGTLQLSLSGTPISIPLARIYRFVTFPEVLNATPVTAE